MKQVYLFQVRSTRAAEREGRWYNAIIVTAATLSVGEGEGRATRALSMRKKEEIVRGGDSRPSTRARRLFNNRMRDSPLA